MKSKGNPLSKHSILHRIREKLSRFWSRLLHGLGKSPPVHIQPLPPASEELRQVDWSAQNAMIGTVRNREQLHYTLSHNCYYVPARFMPEDRPPIQHISLHEWDAEEIPCIVRIGQVKSVERVEQRAIPVTMRKETDPKELYIYYTVEEWLPLPHRILIRDTARGKPLFTSKFLLEHCRTSYELFVISSEQDYRLLEGIYALLSARCSAVPTCPVTKNRILSLENATLTLADAEGNTLCHLPLKSYTASPRNAFLCLKKFLI